MFAITGASAASSLKHGASESLDLLLTEGPLRAYHGKEADDNSLAQKRHAETIATIAATAGNPSPSAAKAATTTIPIVCGARSTITPCLLDLNKQTSFAAVSAGAIIPQ